MVSEFIGQVTTAMSENVSHEDFDKRERVPIDRYERGDDYEPMDHG